jgi:zinc protease
MKRLFLFLLFIHSALSAQFKVDYEKFTLDNGLTVIFHVDKSDPVVAVNLTAHVGSAREKAGRTGFAHLFEHLLFLESENLGKGGLDKLSAKIGGSGANGSTSRDRTNYLQTVPADALEKMLWAEADKLGWFINTVTEPVLAKEKQVVKNEKRQGVDNAPYGHTNYVIDKALYPEDHPYNWQVIGSLEDLDNATLEDVKEFFRRWYVPNNVTLVVAGDFDPSQAKQWVHKYFDEIKRGEEIPKLPKRPGVVKEIKKLYHEDNFARVPALTYVWPAVEQYHPDSYALRVLASYLSNGKNAPFYKVLVEQHQLTSSVYADLYASEVAGQFSLSTRAFGGKDLDDVASAFQEAFEKFEKEGISEKDLNRIKAGQERSFYSSLSSVLGKSSSLAQYSIFAGDPGFATEDIKRLLAVSTADVKRVYEKYIKGKNYIATSFVPKGQVELTLKCSVKADVVEEKIVTGAEAIFDASQSAEYIKTPSKIDRSVEPPYGKALNVPVPQVWQKGLSKGAQAYGIVSIEVPLVQMNIVLKGGQLLEDKQGAAQLTAGMLMAGTAKRTAAELEEAIQQLGSQIGVSADKEEIRVSVVSLKRNFNATLDLVKEILLSPRWDEKEYQLLKSATLAQLKQMTGNPNFLATSEFDKLIYGKDHVLAKNRLGTEETIGTIELSDLKAYYSKAFVPSAVRVHAVGDLPQGDVVAAIEGILKEWKAGTIQIPNVPEAKSDAVGKIYFYDVPEAKQSVLRIGSLALKANDKEFYPAVVSNYILGGGGFASRLTQELREGKGYTYGINSGFFGSSLGGSFEIGSGVRTNVTKESLESILSILKAYPSTFSDQDLETTKGFLLKSQARAFETASAKLGFLENLSKYGWKPTYIKDREKIVQNMTIPQIQKLASQYMDPQKMVWVVVGDAKTQCPRLKELGFGEPILLK